MSAVGQVVPKPKVRLLDKYQKWSQGLPEQPEFGAALAGWMRENGLSAERLAILCDCKPETVKRWLRGSVPNGDSQERLRDAGFEGEFYPARWRNEWFISSELVEVENKFWRPGQDEKKQRLQKYLIRARMPVQKATGRGSKRVVEEVWEEVELLIPTRVSDVIEIISKGDALIDWACCETMAGLIGQPVLHGTYLENGQAVKVEITGTPRKIKSWQAKCLTSKLVWDSSRARIHPWSMYSELELQEFWEKAFAAKYVKRDQAGEYGTRAHKLGQAWILYQDLQDPGQDGFPSIDIIYAPGHFWRDGGSDLVEAVDIFFEPEPVQNSLAALRAFWIDNFLRVVATEALLCDLENGVAGAVDCVARDRNGGLVLLDWKTSNGVYSSMVIQVCLYVILWELRHPEPIDRAYIVRLDKLSGAFQVVPVFTDLVTKRKRLQTARNCIALMRDNQEINRHLSRYGEVD